LDRVKLDVSMKLIVQRPDDDFLRVPGSPADAHGERETNCQQGAGDNSESNFPRLG
jgi:hypothetical protein